jgi:hypothetical protein
MDATYRPGMYSNHSKDVEVGSPMMDDFRYALQLLERHAADELDPDETLACTSAIETLQWMTEDPRLEPEA